MNWHSLISYTKSFFRIVFSCLALYYNSFEILAYGLIAAELLGIVEEFKP